MATYSVAYPGTVPSFPNINPRVDGTNIVSAVDVNSLYGEVIQMATYVGANPHIRGSGADFGTGQFLVSAQGTVRDRINNVENGTYIAYNDFLSMSAKTVLAPDGVTNITHNTIKPASGNTTTVNLILSPQTSQTADLFQALVGSTVVTRIKADGTFLTSTIDGGSA